MTNAFTPSQRRRSLVAKVIQYSLHALLVAFFLLPLVFMPRPPPVDTLSTASQALAIRGMNSRKSSGRASGRPVTGSRAWRWMIAAPARAASIAAPAISSGVTGRWGDIVGVWMPPVGAHVMMTLFGMSRPCRSDR